MRKRLCVLMMTLCLLAAGCGETGGEDGPGEAELLRQAYRDMTDCSMTAEVTCGGGEDLTAFTLQCDYVPEGESRVEVLAPETTAGVAALVNGENLTLTYEELTLPLGTLSGEEVSPAVCLPCLMDALRDGWLLEENVEELDGASCLRLSLDRTGGNGGKIVSTVWLDRESGVPRQGDIAVDGDVILEARFTEFKRGGIIEN